METVYFKIYIFLDCDTSEHLLEASINGFEDLISLNKKSGSGKDVQLQQYATVYLITFDFKEDVDRDFAVGFESLSRFYTPVREFIRNFKNKMDSNKINIMYIVDKYEIENEESYIQYIEHANNTIKETVLIEQMSKWMEDMGIDVNKRNAIINAVESQL